MAAGCCSPWPPAASNCECEDGDDTGSVMDDVDLGTLELEASRCNMAALRMRETL